MSKKIIFMITFVGLSISNRFEAMMWPFLVGLVDEKNEEDINDCSALIWVAITALDDLCTKKNPDSYDELVQKFKNQENFQYLSDSHWSISKRKKME